MKNIISIIFLLSALSIQANELEDFTLNEYGTSKSINLKSIAKKKKKVVINFWASWCTACIQELDELEALKNKYEKEGVHFIAVNAGEKKKKIKRFFRKYKFSYQILEDQDRKVSKMLDVRELPQTIVIDKDLKILYRSDKPPKDL